MALSALAELLDGPLVGIHVFLWATLIGNLFYLRRHRRRTRPARYPSVSVCIPARNEADNLRRLLPSLAAQDYPEEVDVRVWDDGSDDGTWAVLEEAEASSDLVTALRGSGPPAGWVGKVHALYQATREADGERYLFLDADAELAGPDALKRIVERFNALPERSVASALPRLGGAAQLLVSLVPTAILTGLPWPLVRRLPIASLSALNGQCWMIDADTYHRHEPHEAVRDEVLEDVEIGRYLKREGIIPVLLDLRAEVTVHMYASFADAWRGFRKNAYLILGGSPAAFAVLFAFFLLVWVLAPLAAPALLASIYGLKVVTDRINGTPALVSALAPLSFLLGSALQFDSALHHWLGKVSWKGRRVAASADGG
jgi:hypothetical protein